MLDLILKFGDVVVSRIKSKEDFQKFVDALKLEGRDFVIKPNWVDPMRGSCTGAKVLKLLFECIEGKITIIESYTAWRNKPALSFEERITAKNAKENWEWIKEQDKWFLEYSGIGKLLEEYNVDYINITEEIWSGRATTQDKIKRMVEEKFEPVKTQEFYTFVPQKVFDLRGSTLISLAKVKTDAVIGMTLSTKNYFGLIPIPLRAKYHGRNYTRLSQAIVDINKVYKSLFNTVSINEAIFATMEGNWPEECNVRENWGYAIGSKNSVSADIVAAFIAGMNPKTITHLGFAGETFGGYDEKILEKIPKKIVTPLKLPDM